MGRAGMKEFAITENLALRGEGSLAPVDVAIDAFVRAVQTVITTLDRAGIEPDGPFIGYVIAIGIAQFPNMRRSNHLDGAVMNEESFRKRQMFSKGSRVIEDATTILID